MSRADSRIVFSLWRGEVRVRPEAEQTAWAIVSEVAEAYRVAPEALIGGMRKWRLAPARQAAMAALRAQVWPNGSPRYSLPWIAQFLGLKDHTSVIHGLRAHERRLAA